MAELSISRSGKGDRGQLILVTGFALAFVLVALVLLLNTTIYTENIASRGIDRSPDEAVEFRVAVTDGLRDLIAATDDSAYQEDNFSDTLANFSRMMERGYEDRGTIAVVDNSTAAAHLGTLVRQTNHTRNFMSDQAVYTNWTVADNIEDVRSVQFKINISNSQLEGREKTFFLQFNDSTDSSNNWSIYIYRPGANEIGIATARNGSGLFGDVCTFDHGGEGNVTIDITEGELAGEECDVLEWWDGNPPDSYELRFWNATKAAGTYNMTFNESMTYQSNFYTDSGGPEAIDDALYSMRVRLRYQTSTLSYETNVTVAPGEPDNV